MIKVTTGEKPQEEKTKTFPKLMISGKGNIVFFLKEGKGLFVSGPDFSVHYDDKWLMHDFTDYNEPITIQNA